MILPRFGRHDNDMALYHTNSGRAGAAASAAAPMTWKSRAGEGVAARCI